MGSIAIVVDAPGLDDLAGMAVAREQMLVEGLVTEPAVYQPQSLR